MELTALELDQIATALSDQNDYERRLQINTTTGELVFWTQDTGIDGYHPIDLDDLDPDLLSVEPLPSHVWYHDMADFAGRLSDERAAGRLRRAIAGRGAFRRFKDELHREYLDLLPVWYAFRDNRAQRRAVEWLLDQGLIDQDTADRFIDNHPDPELP